MAVEESITTGSNIVIVGASDGFFIYTAVSETCEHPRDYIYMPWGYSPWINASSATEPSATEPEFDSTTLRNKATADSESNFRLNDDTTAVDTTTTPNEANGVCWSQPLLAFMLAIVTRLIVAHHISIL